SCQAAVPNFVAGTVASDNCSAVTITQSPAAGTLVGIGPHAVVITAADIYGNSSTCNTSFTVNDTTPPTITSCAPAQSASANSSCQAAVPDFTSQVIASDNCTFTITQSPVAGVLVGLGPHPVAITLTDGSGNT